jgi:hypothetical protein
MYKLVAVFSLCLFSFVSEAQVIVKWSELVKDWNINSGGYPSEEPALDSLYYKLSSYRILLKADSTYMISYSKDNVEYGNYSINKRKRELTLTNKNTNQSLIYSVAELTPDILVLTILEKYNWAYYLSLTSHK